MLRTTSEIKGYAVAASDGRIGTVSVRPTTFGVG